MKKPFALLLLAVALHSAQANIILQPVTNATISWGNPTAIVGDLDVATNGGFVSAFHFGGGTPPDTAVNGVTFTGVNPGFGTSVTFGGNTLAESPSTLGAYNGAGTAAPYTGLTTSYRALVGSGVGAFAAATITLTLNGLTAGHNYQIQIWNNASASSTLGSTTIAAGNSVVLNSNTTGLNGGLGQFAVGTFTPGLTSQDITFNGSTTSPTMNGYQLRDLSIAPEPSTWALLIGGAALLGWVQKRRRAW